MCGLVVVCDCEIVVVGAAGERVIAAADLFAGALETTLEPTEIITGIRFPPWPPGRRWAFLEQARRKGDFAIAGLALHRSEEHTSELQSLMRIPYAVFCLKKKTHTKRP